jgi:hypothetical protein
LHDGQRFDEMVIPYRPKHSFQKKIRKSLHLDQRIWFALVLVCLVCFFAVNPHLAANPVAALVLPLPFFVLMIGAAFSWTGIEMYNSAQPTHFGLSAKGLRLYWIRWFGDNSSEYIPWNNISHVRLRRTKDFGMLGETWIDFVGTTGSIVFTLRIDGIVTGEQRKRLHTALKQYLSPTQIEPALHDLLNPVKVDGYTQLWLEVLATSPHRLRQDALPLRATIANDRYEIHGHIGSGGQGTAYIGRAVAGALGPGSAPLEVVLKEFVLPYNGGLGVTKKALDSIQREADLLRQLKHPQIVRLVDLFVEDQRAYLVLEHIEGESLRNIVERQGKYDEQQVINLGMQMCDILCHLHGQNPPVLHRDFTPENLIMSVDGQLKLIDFNVAQVMQTNATRTVVGKHSYISPEQFRGKANPQSDIYALGATLFFLLTGREPEPISVAHPRKLNNEISPELDAIVAEATAPDCDVRFKSTQEVKEALQKLQARVCS